MAMNLGKYNEYLDAIQNKKSLSNVVNGGGFTSNREKITDEKKIFRFLPFDDGEPFKVIFKHYIDRKEYICPSKNKLILKDKFATTKCPICEFGSKLYKDSQKELNGRKPDKISKEELANSPKLREAVELYKMFKDMMPISTVFCNVVVRGRESEGAKVLFMTQKTFEKILLIISEQIEDEDKKDITDLVSGSDFKIFKKPSKKEINGMKIDEIEVVYANSKPLTDNKDLEKKILNSMQIDPFSYEIPGIEKMEAAIAKKFNYTDSEVESMSSEKVIQGDSGEEPEDELQKMMREMNS